MISYGLTGPIKGISSVALHPGDATSIDRSLRLKLTNFLDRSSVLCVVLGTNDNMSVEYFVEGYGIVDNHIAKVIAEYTSSRTSESLEKLLIRLNQLEIAVTS